MRVLLWPLFSRLAYAKANTGLAGTTDKSATLVSVRWVGVAQPDTVVAGTTGEGAAQSSFCLVGEGSFSHCDGRHNRRGRCSGLCLISWRQFRQPLWRPGRKVRALLYALFDRSAWANPPTMVKGTTVEGAAPDSVRLVSEGSDSHCGGGQDR